MPENLQKPIKDLWSEYPEASVDQAAGIKNLAEQLLKTDKGLIVEFVDTKTHEKVSGRLFDGNLLVANEGVMLVKYIPEEQVFHIEWAVPFASPKENQRIKITN